METKILKIGIRGNEIQVQELTEASSDEISFENIAPGSVPELWNSFDAIFILDRGYKTIPGDISVPVFINEVIQTIAQTGLPSSVVRINLWPGFAANELWEIAGNLSVAHENILTKFGKKFILLADEPGLLSARVIAMIINEAYFAIEDGVSTAEEIDIAMKLGTNYPYGPVEWAKKIGTEKIFGLLNNMSASNKQYTPSALLKESCT